MGQNISKLKKKIELSKDVINNYERTIEKLHRELEYYKIKASLPDIQIPETIKYSINNYFNSSQNSSRNKISKLSNVGINCFYKIG